MHPPFTSIIFDRFPRASRHEARLCPRETGEIEILAHHMRGDRRDADLDATLGNIVGLAA